LLMCSWYLSSSLSLLVFQSYTFLYRSTRGHRILCIQLQSHFMHSLVECVGICHLDIAFIGYWFQDRRRSLEVKKLGRTNMWYQCQLLERLDHKVDYGYFLQLILSNHKLY
jgi:hypothetical protein